MPKFAANLSMMFTELPFLERFQAAADCGFKGVEFLFPYDFEASDVADAVSAAGVEVALYNMPPGDWDNGERGFASLPGREDEFAAGIETALRYAAVLNPKCLHVMAGIPGDDADRDACLETYVGNLRRATEACAEHGIDALIEPINTRDIPGFFLNRQDEAHRVRGLVGLDNLKVQMDLYHCQIVEGDVAMKIREYLPSGGVGHFQIAGVPERHEPDIGEMNYPYLFDLIDALGYDGWVGCEYRPQGETRSGLGWASRYGIG